MSAFVVTVVAAFVNITAFLGLLTMAARACPAHAEGTVFALLMSVYNMGIQVGSVWGGHLYDSGWGYRWLIGIAAAFTAAMGFLLPFVRARPEDAGVA